MSLNPKIFACGARFPLQNRVFRILGEVPAVSKATSRLEQKKKTCHLVMLKLSQNSRQGMGGRPPGVQRRESDVRLPRHELRFVLQIIFRKIVTSDLVMRNTLCQLINPKNTFLKLTHLENDHPYKDFFRQQQREMPRRHGSRPGSFTARRSVLFRNVVWIKSQGGTLVARIDPARAARTSD